ncbi:hypothetical protein BDV25DRAFT_59654 [Aspergillus avenaceus]|uniref:F-box domain protein n=1 Tax=Aspergillus avenaceus TaxID=36643 RepID=A0A5N6U1U8_ASPAV|nr:hypothetical protein BDV25DRAFT_59654 [Aspergillus avenaceus]
MDRSRRIDDLADELINDILLFVLGSEPSSTGWSHILNNLETDNFTLSRTHKMRLEDQEYIVNGDHDMLLLQRAISAFSSLQEIKLLRLQDEAADEALLDHMREQSQEETACFDWEPACTRAIANLAISLLQSDCKPIRFVGPQISPESAIKLMQTPSRTLSALAPRLTSLNIHFHSIRHMPEDMTSSIRPVSHIFHDFLLATKNLTALSIGFQAKAPLDLSLERIFHRLQWKRLQTLSFKGWRLDSKEIISLFRRHRRQLRVIEMTEVYLRPGSRWRDVLSVLRDEMEQIDRIYLQDIDYADRPSPNSPTGNGHAVSAEYPSIIAEPSRGRRSASAEYHTSAPLGCTRRSIPQTKFEDLSVMTADDLGDNGVNVRQSQVFSLWEPWVLSGPRNVLRQLI